MEHVHHRVCYCKDSVQQSTSCEGLSSFRLELGMISLSRLVRETDGGTCIRGLSDIRYIVELLIISFVA